MSFEQVPCADCDLPGVAGIEAAEIIVAAAGDPAGTARASRRRARLLWPDGDTRARLMNATAAAASGEVLFFFHADSAPPRDALGLMVAVFSDNRVAGGAFAHRSAESGWRLQSISGINRLRSRLTRYSCGDQGTRRALAWPGQHAARRAQNSSGEGTRPHRPRRVP